MDYPYGDFTGTGELSEEGVLEEFRTASNSPIIGGEIMEVVA